MSEILLSLATGAVVGAIFTLLKLPVPAPGVFAGIIGIFGIYLGMVIVNFLKGLL